MFEFTKAEKARAVTLLPASGTIIIKSEFHRVEVVDIDREIANLILESSDKKWKQEFLNCDPLAVSYLVYDFAITSVVKKVRENESVSKIDDILTKISSPEVGWNRVSELVRFAWF